MGGRFFWKVAYGIIGKNKKLIPHNSAQNRLCGIAEGSMKKEYHGIAKKRWPAAAWIEGDGPIALVAHCGGVTVSLYPARAEAEQAKQAIDAGGCGSRCRKKHEIVFIA
jgi:hypothetical protein